MIFYKIYDILSESVDPISGFQTNFIACGVVELQN